MRLHTVVACALQAFCDDSVTATVSAVNSRSSFAARCSASELTDDDRLDDMQPAGEHGPHHHHCNRLQQQQQRPASSPTADVQTLSQNCDVDLSPADADDSDSMQVRNTGVHRSHVLQ